MCTAQSAQGFGMGMQLIGGLTSAFASRGYHDANAAYLTQMNEVNQAQAAQAENSTLYAGGMQSSQARNRGLSLAKTQRTAMASHGLSQSTTYQNILDDTISRSERDAMAIMYNADVQAKNIRTNAALSQAQMLSQAAQERAAGKIAFQSGILSTISQFGESWAKWSQTSGGNLGTKGRWSGVPVYKTPNGQTYRYDGSMGFNAGARVPATTGASGGYMPSLNTGFYTGVNSIDWNPNKYSAMRNRSSSSLWGGGF